MSEGLTQQSIIDEEHLKLLSIGFMVSAGINAFFSLFGLMYGAMGLIIGSTVKHVAQFPANAAHQPPAFIGWIVGGIGIAIFFIMISMAALKFAVAICIKRRKSRTFCLVVAGIGCLGIPFGLLLGVFTFIVLGRDSVTHLFDARVSSRSVA